MRQELQDEPQATSKTFKCMFRYYVLEKTKKPFVPVLTVCIQGLVSEMYETHSAVQSFLSLPCKLSEFL